MLSEAASGIEKANSSKLALIIIKKGSNTVYSLYSVIILENCVNQIISEKTKKFKKVNDRSLYDEEVLYKELIDTIRHDAKNVIVAYVETSNIIGKGATYHSKMIGFSAAEKGWGPLLYDIAMTNEILLTPDRKTVSDSAKNIWKYYYNNRPDIKKLKIDDFRNPKTPDPNDDGFVYDEEFDYLNYVYTGADVDFNSLLQKSKDCINSLSLFVQSKLDVNEHEVKKNLSKAIVLVSNDFFSDKY